MSTPLNLGLKLNFQEIQDATEAFTCHLADSVRVGMFFSLLKNMNREQLDAFAKNNLDENFRAQLQYPGIGLKIHALLNRTVLTYDPKLMDKTNKPFDQWHRYEVEKLFGLRENADLPDLKQWLELELALPSEENQKLEELRDLLREEVWNWNEEELKMEFISPMLKLVNFREVDSKAFFDRRLKLDLKQAHLMSETNLIEVAGKVDCLIARKTKVPEAPYFCLHEFKKEENTSQDPLGQLLIAMLAAQQENPPQTVLYGCYVSGRSWFFVVLKDLEYAVSLAYDATKDEIFEIYAILKNLKTMIAQRI
ncbi:MAG: hypothetical protein HC880_17430 [Bacteroidia bacterium]|nr:hypothetical protein [Bacteroidia bacterium]